MCALMLQDGELRTKAVFLGFIVQKVLMRRLSRIASRRTNATTDASSACCQEAHTSWKAVIADEETEATTRTPPKPKWCRCSIVGFVAPASMQTSREWSTACTVRMVYPQRSAGSRHIWSKPHGRTVVTILQFGAWSTCEETLRVHERSGAHAPPVPDALQAYGDQSAVSSEVHEREGPDRADRQFTNHCIGALLLRRKDICWIRVMLSQNLVDAIAVCTSALKQPVITRAPARPSSSEAALLHTKSAAVWQKDLAKSFSRSTESTPGSSLFCHPAPKKRDMNAVNSDSESDSDSGSDEEVETKKKLTEHTDCNKGKAALTAGPPARGQRDARAMMTSRGTTTCMEVSLLCGMKGEARPVEVAPVEEVSTAPESKMSWCTKFAYNLVLVLFIFALSFFISTSSLHITGDIVENMDQQAAEHDGPGTTAFGAVAILMMVIFVQVAFFSLLIKGVQRLCAYAFPVAVAEVSDDYPSAPPASPKRGITHSHAVQHNALVSSTASGRTWHRLVNFDASSIFASRASTSEGYAPLLSSEEGNEMVSVTAPQVFQNGVAMPQQIVMVPFTKVNMV
eukprot:gene33255-41035_t